jgi:hypothetical protein
MEDQQFSR